MTHFIVRAAHVLLEAGCAEFQCAAGMGSWGLPMACQSGCFGVKSVLFWKVEPLVVRGAEEQIDPRGCAFGWGSALPGT